MHGRTDGIGEHVVVKSSRHTDVVTVRTTTERMGRNVQAATRRIEPDPLRNFTTECHLFITRQVELV